MSLDSFAPDIDFKNLEARKQAAQVWFENLRDQICQKFIELEQIFCQKHPGTTPGQFVFTPWDRAEGGGGTMGLMKVSVFEKVGVNVSTVWGKFAPQFQAQIQGAEVDPRFWASGISVVAHMASPLVPAIHMNTRHIVTTKAWFGGGTDLTPYYPFEEDTRDFHEALKTTCDATDLSYHPKFKKWCDDYFYLPHRKETRGVGGIFYDYINTGNWDKDFAFTQNVGSTFLNAYAAIVTRRMNLPWTPEQREHQLQRRGRYVEFNLLYDRGTTFGLKTDGNIEAILMSMPPEAKWA